MNDNANILDRFVSFLSPKWGAERAAYRLVHESVLKERASPLGDRFTGDWKNFSGSADSTLIHNLAIYRQRFRQLQLTNPFVARQIDALVIGAVKTGLNPQSLISADATTEGGAAIGAETAKRFAQQAETFFGDWCHEADATNRHTFQELQAFVLSRVLCDGEIFVRKVAVKEATRTIPYALQCYEAEQISTPMDKGSDRSIREGVELGERGQPVAYWVRKVHPGDTITVGVSKSNDFEHVPAAEMMHLFLQKRPGQTRGYPILVPALRIWQDLDKYWEAEIVAARVAACYAGFIKTLSPSGAIGALSQSTESGNYTYKDFELQPGKVRYLSPNQEISFGDPKRPAEQFAPFSQQLIRAGGLVANLPYELQALDFSKTNYSSARAALLEARAYFAMLTRYMIDHLCSQVWNDVIVQAVGMAQIMVPDGFNARKRDWLRQKWYHPGYDWIDKLGEERASTEALDSGVESLQEHFQLLGL